MSYKYRPGHGGMDIIVTTKKGIEEGGLPKGVIIPIGYKWIPEVADYIKNASCCVYAAKHCENPDVITHIQSHGTVNLFGWYLTNMEVLSIKPNWTLDIGTGCLRRVTVQNIQEIEKYL